MSRKERLMKTKFRLLLLAAILTGTALLSAARPAASQCVFYCWRVDSETTCCTRFDCSVWCG
jgi:hypothetical protein